jgi:hypothetical protein
MNEETKIYEAEDMGMDYGYESDSTELGACFSEISDSDNSMIKYAALGAAITGGVILIGKGIKAIVKKVKSKDAEEERPARRAKAKKVKVDEEDIVDVEPDELEDVEEEICDDEPEEETKPKKKK